MGAKTERITILGSAEFKTFLVNEAEAANISVSEWVRRRCLQSVAPDEDTQELAELVAALHVAVDQAKDEMNSSLDFAHDVLRELKTNREAREKAAS